MRNIHYVTAIDRLGRYVSCNECNAQDCYYDPEELIGASVGDTVKDPEEARQLRAAFSECLFTGKPQTSTWTGVYGERLRCQLNKVVQNSGRSMYADDEVAVIMITQRLPQDCQLSKRELEIVQLICEDKGSGEIARLLGVKPSTIETHRQNIRQKIGANGSAGIVRYAIEQGLVD